MKLVLFLFAVFFSYKGFAKALVLSTHSPYKIKASSNEDVYVSDGKHIKIVDKGSYIKVTAKNQGESFITVGKKTYTINSLSKRNYNFYKKLSLLTKDMLGLKVDVQNAKIIVAGDLYRLEDLIKMSEINNGIDFVFKARPHEKIKKQVRDYLTAKAKINYLSVPKVIIDKSIKIFNKNKNDKAKLNKLYRLYGLSVQHRLDMVEFKPMIKVKIILAEISKDLSRNLGVSWSNNLKAQLLPNKSLSASQLEAQLRFLESRGQGQILASPTVISKSGKEADFHAGGEFPIKTFGFKSEGVTWKRYGIFLKTKPIADSDGNIDLTLSTEISMVDSSQATKEGIPAFKTNRLTSQFNLKNKKSIMISGLIKEAWGSNNEGLAFLSDIPIFGKLFSSENYRHNKSELVIFVVPTILRDKKI